MATFDQITRHDDVDPDEDIWVGGRPIAMPIVVVEPDPLWPVVFEDFREILDNMFRSHGML